MRNDLFQRRYSLFVMTCLLIAFSVVLSSPKAALAAACFSPNSNACFQGWVTRQFNYGSEAIIGTPTQVVQIPSGPYGAGPLASFMFVLSQIVVNGEQKAFVQTGWNVQLNTGCPDRFFLIAEYLDITGYSEAQGKDPLHSFCDLRQIDPGDQKYTTYYDGGTDRWYHLYNGIVWQSEPANLANASPDQEPTGYIFAEEVAVYGETNDTRIQMGGQDSANKVVARNISFKPAPTGNLVPFTLPPIQPAMYDSCKQNICPYRTNTGGAAGTNVWFVEVWTQRPSTIGVLVTRTDDNGTGNDANTLSWAIRRATPGQVIVFGQNVSTINVTGNLPFVVPGIIIDGGTCTQTPAHHLSEYQVL